MLLSLLSIVLVLVFLFLTAGILWSAPKYKGPVSSHFNGKTFQNPNGQQAKTFKAVLQWMMKRQKEPWGPAIRQEIPRQKINSPEGIRVTFVNHATFLIQIGSFNVLTDPVWSDYVGPFSRIGPRRKRPPGILMDDLPPIHYILLSHNHYDHLDVRTLKALHKKHRPRVITPLGVGRFMAQLGLNALPDLDWWDRKTLSGDLSVQALPASHFSGRGLLDRNATLWCGYLIRSPHGTVYFAGDSGYGDFFHEIADNTPPITLALLPIGAYKPEWFMSPIHTSPEEAVKVHQILKPSISIGSHFGTFPLADDGRETPVLALKKALDEARIPPETFITLKEGESYAPGQSSSQVP